ncbi:MAG: PQQ-binding-like beta-propeller repeat protein [Kiritimatiellaceae bacterium]|nr:PQQ-binding-like beta-propeller repeat protein [Kiritimatiellaceae bacterium]
MTTTITRLLNLYLITIAGVIVLACSAGAADWPNFLGPNTNNISSESGLNKSWSNQPPRTLWTVALTDDGYAAPSVAGGKLFIVDHLGSNDIVRALDIADGHELWRYEYLDATAPKQGFTASTPLVAGNKVYTFSRLGKVYCFNTESGKMLWNRDLAAEYKSKRPPWLFCASPVVDGDKLIFIPSGEACGLLFLDKNTGKVLKEAAPGFRTSYATPVIATFNGVRQYVLFGTNDMAGFSADDGKELWQVPWPTKFGGKKGPTPLLLGDNRIFAATTEGGDTGVIDLSSGSPVVVWKHQQMQDHFPTPVFYHGRIYGSSDPKFLVCLDPADGRILWKEPTGQYTSVIAADDTVIALSGSTGDLIMLDATVPEYRELGRITPLGGTSWTAPILSDGRLYVRNKGAIACIDLRASGGK